MLNEERVAIMTKLAAYEEGEGKKNADIGNYYRNDYLGVHILKAVVCATLVFLIVFGLYIVYDFEVFMQDLYKIDIIAFAKDVLKKYVLFVVVYCIMTYAYCTYRYMRAKKGMKSYYLNLKKLNSLYNEGSHETSKKKKKKRTGGLV